MPRYVAFLRAINVGGHVVKMDALRTICAGVSGCTDVETFIASGNVIFTSRATDGAALERRLEAALQKALGYPVATFIRTPDELAAIAAFSPCGRYPLAEGGSVFVIFLSQAPDAAARRRIEAVSTPEDELSVKGREVYWCRYGNLLDSPLSGAKMDRTLGSATMRNRNTVVRLLARLSAPVKPAAAAGRRRRKETS